MTAPASSKTNLLICLALLFATFALYARVAHFDFINFDDNVYITRVPQLRDGLSLAGIRWALTSAEAGYWYPVTRFTQLLDVQLFGYNAGMHHMDNVFWHALASLCVFAFLQRATGATFRSAFVAFLFALHPLRVESVAWITERKDVLSAFFFFLTLWAYVRYAERPSTSRYLVTLLYFLLGLASKTMVVTLPFVLVLLDIWPLKRWSRDRLKEKLPFLALAAVIAVVSFFAQRNVGAVVTVDAAPLALRLENALTSYVLYLWMTVWPAGLAIFYPYVQHAPVWQPLLAGVGLVAVSILVVRQSRRRPYWLVGWTWYVITLLPVIGLVQIGEQGHADRYMYIPTVGVLMMLAWTIPAKPVYAGASVLVCIAAAAVSWAQIGYWQNSETVFRRAVEVTTGNYVAHYSLGVVYGASPGRAAEAIAEYQQTLETRPKHVDALVNLGALLAQSGRLPEAISRYQEALRIEPGNVMAHNNLGAALARMPGHLSDAIAEYQAAVRARPGDPAVITNLTAAYKDQGDAYARAGQWPQAIGAYQSAIRFKPEFGEAHNNLGFALINSGLIPKAIEEFREAVRDQPDYADAHANLALALLKQPGHESEALDHLSTSLRLKPNPELEKIATRLKTRRP